MNKKSFPKTLSTLIIILFFQTLHAQDGKFYNSLSDYIKDLPIPGYVVKPGISSYSIFQGEKFTVGKDELKARPTRVSRFPADLFTFKNYTGFFLLRAYKGKSYIVITYGKLCFYAAYFAQESWYYSETITGDLKKFNSKTFEASLAQFKLLENYKKEEPKYNQGESRNTFYNRQVLHVKTYYDLLNEKIK